MPNRPPPAGGTPRVCVLVANEPRVYREALAGALAALRPEASVVAVEPAELDGMVVRTRPDLVFCSSLAPAVEAGDRAWTLLTRTARRGSRRASTGSGRSSPISAWRPPSPSSTERSPLLRAEPRCPATGEAGGSAQAGTANRGGAGWVTGAPRPLLPIPAPLPAARRGGRGSHHGGAFGGLHCGVGHRQHRDRRRPRRGTPGLVGERAAGPAPVASSARATGSLPLQKAALRPSRRCTPCRRLASAILPIHNSPFFVGECVGPCPSSAAVNRRSRPGCRRGRTSPQRRGPGAANRCQFCARG
jgi:hypothetical protein